MDWVSLRDHQGEIERGAVFRLPAQWPYEEIVEFMVAETSPGSAGRIGLTSPHRAEVTDAGTVAVRSGALALLPATSSGEEIPAALAQLSPCGAVRVATESAESALVVRQPTGRYQVRIDEPAEGTWGRATRASLAAVDAIATP